MVNRLFEGCGPRLVAIAGGSGSGKSWLAEQLLRLLGKDAARLSLDDFYRDRSHLPMKRRGQINFDHPRAVDWAALERVLAGSKAGLPAMVPKYDFKLHASSSAGAPWRPKPLVLVEGLWLLRRRTIRQLFSFTIFVECPERVRLRRRIVRDMAERGRSAESIREQFRRVVAPMHDRYVASQVRWADMTVSSPINISKVQRIARRLEDLLSET
jgi:uridine kinase